MFRFLPEQASAVAPRVDWLHNLITDLAVFFTVAICGAMVYFAIRYRKRGGVDHETPQIHGSTLLEIIWTVVPTIICVFIAYYGVAIFYEMHDGEKDALAINVTAKKWIWQFQYENGKHTVGEFVVPVGKPIKLVLTSEDVLHSFFIPTMRVKKDAVPGAYTSLVFTPVKSGTYNTFCTEYCGTSHSAMLAKVKVVPVAEYERWVNDRTDDLARLSMSPAKLGSKLYIDKGCNACHSLNGQRIVGPTFQKLYMSDRKFEDGSTAKGDEEYIRESILQPASKVVEGYPKGVMPAFEGQLDDSQIKALIAFIKEQDGSAVSEEEAGSGESESEKLAAMSPEERGQYIYQNKACIGCHTLDGSAGVGPTFKGVYGRSAKFQDGTEYTVTDEYIKNSILNPSSQIVAGFAGAMPPYAGQLNDDDIAGVIAYLKTVK